LGHEPLGTEEAWRALTAKRTTRMDYGHHRYQPAFYDTWTLLSYIRPHRARPSRRPAAIAIMTAAIRASRTRQAPGLANTGRRKRAP
jgi:hypothetical protein